MSFVTTEEFNKLVARVESLEAANKGLEATVTELSFRLSVNEAAKKVTKPAADKKRGKTTPATPVEEVVEAPEEKQAEEEVKEVKDVKDVKETKKQPKREGKKDKVKAEPKDDDAKVGQEKPVTDVKSKTNINYSDNMNIMEFFKSNYLRYEPVINSIETVKAATDKKVKENQKFAKKTLEDQHRSKGHIVWLLLRNTSDLSKVDEVKAGKILKLIESEKEKASKGDELPEVPTIDAEQKNTVEINGKAIVITDDEVSKHLTPEDESD